MTKGLYSPPLFAKSWYQFTLLSQYVELVPLLLQWQTIHRAWTGRA